MFVGLVFCFNSDDSVAGTFESILDADIDSSLRGKHLDARGRDWGSEENLADHVVDE